MHRPHLIAEPHRQDRNIDVTISRTQSRRAAINSAFRTRLVPLSEVGLLAQWLAIIECATNGSHSTLTASLNG